MHTKLEVTCVSIFLIFFFPSIVGPNILYKSLVGFLTHFHFRLSIYISDTLTVLEHILTYTNILLEVALDFDHDKCVLQVLNLQNCRIKALPERMFNRLPNLKKLDLSHNYMVTLNTEVLQPLPKLERVELRNEYWKCDPPFIAAESWIVSHGIIYEKICKNRTPKMFEKIISAVTPEKEEIDVNNIWNITKDKNDSVVPISKPTTPLTPFQKFDKEFSSFKALILGIEIGLGLGIVGTYIWLRSLCKCGHCPRPKSRRERRRERRVDAEVRNSLLWTTVIHPDLETPPVFRRQPSLPDENPPYPTYGLPSVVEAGLQIDAICLPDRAETPPPAYSECRMLYGS